MTAEGQLKGKVLDIGAWYPAGCPKRFFDDYTGIDIQPGKAVDYVMSAYDISKKFEKESFDVVLCMNVLEHVPDIAGVLEQVNYVLKPGGYFFISMPEFGFPVHNYPGDYWRASLSAVREYIMKGYDICYIKR